jgi:hypothetical protein
MKTDTTTARPEIAEAMRHAPCNEASRLRRTAACSVTGTHCRGRACRRALGCDRPDSREPHRRLHQLHGRHHGVSHLRWPREPGAGGRDLVRRSEAGGASRARNQVRPEYHLRSPAARAISRAGSNAALTDIMSIPASVAKARTAAFRGRARPFSTYGALRAPRVGR